MVERMVYSYREFLQTYSPNSVLGRLDEELCDHLELDWEHQHRVSFNEEDQRAGFIEVARPQDGYEQYPLERVVDFIVSFYEGEGYSVDRNEWGLEVTNLGVGYSVFIFPHETSFTIQVRRENR
jgi:hypothetical protein